jgi:hypothetical protein
MPLGNMFLSVQYSSLIKVCLLFTVAWYSDTSPFSIPCQFLSPWTEVLKLFVDVMERKHCTQSARWQHVSRLKAVFGKINYLGLKHTSLYLGLVLPSGG